MYKIYLKTDTHQIEPLCKGKTFKAAVKRMIKKQNSKANIENLQIAETFSDPEHERATISQVCNYMLYAYGIRILVEVSR